MKLKIKVKEDDFILFIGVCVVLFLICLIIAANFISFGATEQFVGLNIFKNFSLATLGLTILLFIISLVVIFSSVSSTIFDFDKGFGFSLGEKEEKGYNKFMTEREMKNAFMIRKVPLKAEHAEHAGMVFINDGKNMWVDDGEYHTLIIGQSGSGKTTALVTPLVKSLMKHDESMIITDLKGEIYRDQAAELKERGYNIIVINLRDPSEGNAWNPLTIPYRMYKQGKTDKAKELLEDISTNIIPIENKEDPFWETAASSYFSGLALSLFKHATENEVNITSISNMVSDGEAKMGRETYAQKFFAIDGVDSDTYEYAKSTITAPVDTRNSILSIFLSKIRQFSTRDELSEMLSYSDFNMENIGKEKTALFLIVHDEKKTYHPLATILIKQLYEVLVDVAHHNPDGELKYRTNFILDEFANMPPLKDVDAMVSAARSRKMRFTFIIQNFSQLDDVYGEKKAETIRSNCGNMVYLLTNELKALEEISKLVGESKSKDDEKTVSTPLVSVTDLQKMKMNEIVLIRMRQKPFRTVLKAAYELDYGKEYPKTFPTEREKYPVKHFKLKDYVDQNQRKQTVDDINVARKAIPNEDERIPRANRNYDFNNPFGGAPFEQKNNSVDIDKILKEIDAELARLDEEEKKEKEAKEKAEGKISSDVKVEEPAEKQMEKPKEEPPKSKEEVQKEEEEKSLFDNLFGKKEEKAITPVELNDEVKIEPEKEPQQPIDFYAVRGDTIKEEIQKKYEDKAKTEMFTIPEEIKKEVSKEEKVPVDTSSVVVGNNVVTDDQYFDDFFGDE